MHSSSPKNNLKFKCAALVYHKNIFEIYQKKWITKCIDSIINQSFIEYDILELNYGVTNFSLFPAIIENKKYFWNKHFNSHHEARGFLLHKAFHEMGYDVIFNVQLDKFYHLDRFQYQVDAIQRGYDIISSVNHLSNKNKNKPQDLLNITKHLEDKYYCSQCQCSYPPVYKQIHQLSHNMEKINKSDDIFLDLLQHCFMNIDKLRSNFGKFDKFEKMDDYRECIINSIMHTIQDRDQSNIDLTVLKKLCHYILLFILMIENNSEMTEQLNIRWFIDNNVNIIESASVCLNRNVWNEILDDNSKRNSDDLINKEMGFLWKMLAKTQLKFKIITKVLFKYPEDEDCDDMDIDIETNPMRTEDLQKKIKLYRYEKELERLDRQRRKEIRAKDDQHKRQMKLKKHQEMIELRRRQLQQAQNSNNSSFKFPALKSQNNIDITDHEVKRQTRKLSRQEQKKLRQQQVQSRSRNYNTHNIKEIRL
jgi:hypothetical protein